LPTTITATLFTFGATERENFDVKKQITAGRAPSRPFNRCHTREKECYQRFTPELMICTIRRPQGRPAKRMSPAGASPGDLDFKI
jgi:hypothetical protein